MTRDISIIDPKKLKREFHQNNFLDFFFRKILLFCICILLRFDTKEISRRDLCIVSPTSANLFHFHEERIRITRTESFKHRYYVRAFYFHKSILFFQGYSRLTFHLKKKKEENNTMERFSPKFRIQTVRSQFFQGISFTPVTFVKPILPSFDRANIVHISSCK